MRHLDRTLHTLKGMAPTTPPPETCPIINEALKGIGIAMHAINAIRLEALNTETPVDKDKLEEALAVAFESIDGVPDQMEELRHHNARLRNLSLFWYRTAKQLHQEGGGKQTPRWFIAHKTEALCWSNEDGWVCPSNDVPDRFTDAEKERVTLPMEGTWLEITE